MDFIKSSVLNEDEVTVLTDALLNRQAYDRSNDFQSFHKVSLLSIRIRIHYKLLFVEK